MELRCGWRDWLVTLGTDTFPGNLYAVDAQGVGMRIRLQNPPILPFQPGDIARSHRHAGPCGGRADDR